LKAVNEDAITKFFDGLHNVLTEYEISSDAIYNMDETGFMMGVGGRQKVVVPTGPKANHFKAQAGNRDSTTVIECIGSGGQSIPPLIIFKGRIHLYGDHRRMLGPANDWFFGVSINGWTSNELALKWLRLIFDPTSQQPRETSWRLLLMDGHASHVSMEFLDECWRRRIIPMCFPPHSTHIMQPLDVSIFGPLTRAYRDQVMELGDEGKRIDRALFASMYATARAKTITQMAARKAFVDCGMTIRPDKERVLMRLPGYTPRMQTPSPPPQPDPFNTPRIARRFYAMLRSFEDTENPRERSCLRRKLQKAFEARDADATLLSQHIQQRQQAAQKAKRTVLAGDRKMISKHKMIRRDWAEQQVSMYATQIDREQQAWEGQQQPQQQAEPGPSTMVSNGAPYRLLGEINTPTTPSQTRALPSSDVAEHPIDHSGWSSPFVDPSVPLAALDNPGPPPP
jgi:hypothetical protein